MGKPSTRFPAPRWIINATPGEQVLLFWLPVKGDYEEKRTEPLSAKNWGHVLHDGRVLRHMPPENSVLSVAADGLRLYTLALNGLMPHSRLLGFWQLAEVLTLRMATESVLMRLLGGGHRLKTVLTLEQFYRHHSKPDRELRPLKKALDFIAWLRREKEKNSTSAE